jgi:uncharacterized membrane protein YbhN (UPF0104 family)
VRGNGGGWRVDRKAVARLLPVAGHVTVRRPAVTGGTLKRAWRPRMPTARGWRILLLVTCLAPAVAAARWASAAGASWMAAFRLIGALGWWQVLGLGGLWMLGLYVHTFVLAAALPGLTRRRALTLNLSGSAVSNVLPLGGLAGTALNLTMTRSWGHTRLDFARFVTVSNACDVIAKLLMPVVALAVLLVAGTLTPAAAGAWLAPAGAAFAIGLLLLWALCGHATPLLRLVDIAGRGCTRVMRRQVGAAWSATVSALLAGTDQLVRRRGATFALGMTGYRLAQGMLLWCCLLAVGARPLPAVTFAALVAERAATLVAATPGGTGPAEAGMASVLIALGTDPTAALAGTVLYRAFVFAAEIPVGAAVGIGWWLVRRAHARRDRRREDGIPPVCG